MKRTVDEKYEYNKNRNTPFSNGYTFGVTMYRHYLKAAPEHKADIKALIASSSKDARSGDQWSKGVMCAVRDAADERKRRKS